MTDIELEYKRLSGLGMTFSQPAPLDVGHVKSIYEKLNVHNRVGMMGALARMPR